MTKKTGTEIKFKNENTSVLYGTCNNQATKSFFITVSGWLTVGEIETNYHTNRAKVINKWKSIAASRIRAIVSRMHPDYLYSFTSINFGDSFYSTFYNKKQGFFECEVTIFLDKELIKFTRDISIKPLMKKTSIEIESALMEINSNFRIDRHMTKTKKPVELLHSSI